MINYVLFMSAIVLSILVVILLSFIALALTRLILSLRQRKVFDDVIKKINNNSL